MVKRRQGHPPRFVASAASESAASNRAAATHSRPDLRDSRPKCAEALLELTADSEFQMKSLFEVVQGRLIKLGVSVKNLDIGEIKPAPNDTVRREIMLKTARPTRVSPTIAFWRPWLKRSASTSQQESTCRKSTTP